MIKERESFKPGDVVELNSGGPLMTVYEVKGDEVHCLWFREPAEPPNRFGFTTAVLHAADPSEEGRKFIVA